MRFGLKWLVAIVLLAALVANGRAGATRSGAQADNTVSSGPYKAILDRNVFDLRDPPPPKVAEAPPAALPNVKLVGLMILSGIPQAVLSISEPDTVGKPPTSYILSENQGHSGVEVKEINYTAKTAKVSLGQDGERIAVLKLEEPKQMAPGGVMVGGAGAAGGRAFPNRPGFVPGQAPPMPGAYNNPGASYNAPAYNPGAGFGGGGGGDASIPNRPVRTDSGAPVEQQAYNMEAQRQELLEANSPLASLIPPTTLTSPATLAAMNALNSEIQSGGPLPNSSTSGQSTTGSSANSLIPSTSSPQSQQPFGSRSSGTLLPGR